MFEQRKLCIKSLHLLEGDNVYIVPSTNQRYCRACMKERRKGQRQWLKTKKPIGPPKVTVEPKLWYSFWINCISAGNQPNDILPQLIRDYISNLPKITSGPEPDDSDTVVLEPV